jgi:hypothetical protein
MVLTGDGDFVMLRCQVQNYPPSTVRWEKLNNLGVFEELQDQFLHNITMFAPITFGDEGIYRCVVIPEGFPEQISSTALIAGMCMQETGGLMTDSFPAELMYNFEGVALTAV